MKNVLNNTYAGLAFIFIICSIFIYKAFYFPIHDFANYYFSAFFLKEGSFTSNIYFPYYFNLKIADLGYQNIFVSYAPNIPFLALFFVPFTLCTVTVSKLVFNILGLVLFLYSLKKLFKTYKIKSYYLYIIPLVFFIPLRNNFLFGQTYLILFFLLSEGFLSYKNERFFKVSLFWGFAILLKVFPIILFGLLLFKKKYKAVMLLGLACALLLGISLIINGFEIWTFYLSKVLSKSNNGEIAGEFVQNYQSMFMLLKGLLHSNELLFSIMLLLFKLLLISVGYFITKYETSKMKVFSLWIIISILISPYGSTYTSILLIFPLIFVLKNDSINFKTEIIIFLFFLIANTPVHYFSRFNLPLSFPRLFLILLLSFLFFKSSFKHIKWKNTAFFVIPILIISFFIQKNTGNISNNNLLANNGHTLIYDHTISNNFLSYTYWNENGSQQKQTNIKIETIDSTTVTLINNQVFYKNKQFTFDNSNKLKPIIVNDNRIIFLSDAKRGIGFYALNEILLNKN